ncbi:MAG: FeoB-associated Cys-rich membrane protein [Oceanidesulfovibrio sp.]
MTFDTILVAVIVLLAALYAGRTLYRQAKREKGCGSCGDCCPMSGERDGAPLDKGSNVPRECAGCPSMSAGSSIDETPRR